MARLDGTIYVVGDFNLMPNCTLMLNSQTIFSEGNINFQPNCFVTGTGCVIAVGDVNYQPNIEGDDFVFLMSLEGMVTLKPGNSFYGSIAGDAEVELMPHTTLNWLEPSDGLNFPGGAGSGISAGGMQILTWNMPG